ncbi:hypothetical protein Tco_0947306 [Tanacetum coccineum]
MMPLFQKKTPIIQFGSPTMPTFAYAPHSTSREYTLKTQLLRIEMHGDETPDAYLNRAQEYADALAAIGEPVKDKDLVMLAVSGIREESNGLKTPITARQSLTAFSELHALLNTGTNNHVTPDLAAMDTSEAYYSDDAHHVGNGSDIIIQLCAFFLPMLKTKEEEEQLAWLLDLGIGIEDPKSRSTQVKRPSQHLDHRADFGSIKVSYHYGQTSPSIPWSNLSRGNVFSTWMAFRGNTHDLGSFGEETDKITDLHQIHKEVLFTEHGDGVAGIKRRRRDLSSDGVRDLATASGRGRLKEDLESST